MKPSREEAVFTLAAESGAAIIDNARHSDLTFRQQHGFFLRTIPAQ